MSDQRRNFQNQSGAYPNYGQPQYFQAQPYMQEVDSQAAFQGGQVPYGQPMYYQAPPVQQMPPMYYQPPVVQPPYYQQPVIPQSYYQAPMMQQGRSVYYPTPYAVTPSHIPPLSPEIPVKSSMFEDYGFTANDDLDNGHDFGGLMTENNPQFEDVDSITSEPVEEPVNSRATLNTDISDDNYNNFDFGDNDIFSNSIPVETPKVEEAPKAPETPKAPEALKAEETPKAEEAPKVVETPNVEEAPKAEETPKAEEAPKAPEAPKVAEAPKAPETPKAEEPPKVAETPKAEEAPKAAEQAPPIDFMASMQSMFSSMSSTKKTAPQTPAAPAVNATNTATTPEYKKPDVVVSGASAATNKIQDVSGMSNSNDKGPEYWDYMNRLLNKFDDGQVHKTTTANGLSFTSPAPSVPNAQKEEKVAEKPLFKPEIPAYPPAPKPNIIRDVSGTQPAGALNPTTPLAETNADKNAAKDNMKIAMEFEDVQDAPKSKKSFSGILPKKGDSKSGNVLKIVLIVVLLAALGCGIAFGVIALTSNSDAKLYEELSVTMATGETANENWETIYNKYPNVTFPIEMQTKFADLYALNDDLVGWIRIPGLNIDYPVVQTENDSYYLKHDFNRNESSLGTIFVSSSNSVQFLDQNTVLYGHASKRDTMMFAALKEYKTIEGFKNNPVIEFNTLYSDYKFKVYAVFISNGSAAQDDGYVFQYTARGFSTTESFEGFVEEINQRALYKTGVDIEATDKIITLSSSTDEFDNARLVVVGRLVRADESAEVDTSIATTNESPRYPQAWYDANGQTNPYKNHDKWVPAE